MGHRISHPRASRFHGWSWLLAAFALAWAGSAVQAAPLVVDGRGAIEVWPAVAVLDDAAGDPTVEQLLAGGARFRDHTGTPGNLGRTASAVWLRVPLHVPGTEPVQRVLGVDYAPLNRIDVHLVQGGRLLSSQRIGNHLRQAERPLPARAHAAPLTLPPGNSELLLRVQSTSSLVLPISLRTMQEFGAHEAGSQLMLGLLLGMAGCMLLYSASHWVSLRDRAFADYAVMLGANMLFFMSYFGIGALYLWPDSPLLSTWVPPLAVLLAVAAGANFMRAVLSAHEISRWVARGFRAISVAAVVGLAVGVTGLVEYSVLKTVTTVLALLATFGALPVALVLVWRGERVALWMLFGWVSYLAGAVSLAVLLHGWAEPTSTVLALYPLSTLVEMSAWMVVLGMRVQSIHRSADRARVESETLRTLAHTDALTGLPNRRGLQLRLAAALRGARPQELLAVYLLDLDGFKLINDRFGHNVGDALLVEVGRRLQQQVRTSDVVARLGGDEFVVLAANLPDEATAKAVGQKLLAAFDLPFDAAGQRCEVGLTVGYALAPLDVDTADELIKRADAAMYAGKQAGGRRVQRVQRVQRDERSLALA
jgi:diguanylate cyclase